MKALSIIGIVMSLFGFFTGMFVISEADHYSYSEYSYYNTDEDVVLGGVLFMLISFFFLVFSIIATVFSFRKPSAPPMYPPFQPPYQQTFQQYPPPYQQQQQYPPQYPPQPPQQPPYTQ